MSKITWQGFVFGLLAGIILAPQISRIPLVNKIPQL